MGFKQFATNPFTVEVEGPYHCGPDHTSPKTFTYQVEIEYPSDALDDKGFLLDNTAFGDYFQ